MPVDAKLKAILDAGKALGKKPVEQQTPEEARADRAEMVAGFVPMAEYAGVRVEDRRIPVADGLGGRDMAVRLYRPASGDGPWPVVVFFG
jgi:acetyl esterase